jgi:hypothetical protein
LVHWLPGVLDEIECYYANFYTDDERVAMAAGNNARDRDQGWDYNERCVEQLTARFHAAHGEKVEKEEKECEKEERKECEKEEKRKKKRKGRKARKVGSTKAEIIAEREKTADEERKKREEQGDNKGEEEEEEQEKEEVQEEEQEQAGEEGRWKEEKGRVMALGRCQTERPAEQV